MDEQARAQQIVTGAERSPDATCRPARHAAPTGSVALPPVPGTGSRRVAGPATRRRDLRWVPIALAIWMASFAAIPIAVLVHGALSDEGTSVETAADTREQDDPSSASPPAAAEPAAVPPASQRPATDDPGEAAATADASDPRPTVVEGVVPTVPATVSSEPATGIPAAAPAATAPPTADATSSPSVPSTATSSAGPIEQLPPTTAAPGQVTPCADCPLG